MSFDVEGQNSHLVFALSFTDPAFTANQLGALALYVFSQVLKTSAKDGQQLPPGLLQLVHQAYMAKADAVAAELARAMKENGL